MHFTTVYCNSAAIHLKVHVLCSRYSFLVSVVCLHIGKIKPCDSNGCWQCDVYVLVIWQCLRSARMSVSAVCSQWRKTSNIVAFNASDCFTKQQDMQYNNSLKICRIYIYLKDKSQLSQTNHVTLWITCKVL